MTEKLRFGIIGAGVIGPTHATAIAGLPDAELVAVADMDLRRARTLAAPYGATPYADIQTMLDREALDVVNICTPSGLHGAQACQVMRSGRHVIVEKPMELHREAIEEMLRVQQEAGVQLAVISQHRFDPASQELHALVDEGAFGRLVLGNALIPWWRAQAYYDSGGWRGTAALDGGVLMNQAIHSIDLLQWLMGPVRSVYAYTDTLVHQMETEDVAVAVLRFTSGAVGTLAATTGAYPGAATRIEVYGDQGSAVIENDRLKWRHLARDDQEPVSAYGLNIAEGPDQPEGESAASNPAAIPTSTHAAQIADMIRAIREGGTPLVDGQAGRQPVEIILAVYESARTRQEVMLP
jgi:UDP-N-acetyl-2-amino-2-deoxyglucuronate dehydrogenase